MEEQSVSVRLKRGLEESSVYPPLMKMMSFAATPDFDGKFKALDGSL